MSPFRSYRGDADPSPFMGVLKKMSFHAGQMNQINGGVQRLRQTTPDGEVTLMRVGDLEFVDIVPAIISLNYEFEIVDPLGIVPDIDPQTGKPIIPGVECNLIRNIANSGDPAQWVWYYVESVVSGNKEKLSIIPSYKIITSYDPTIIYEDIPKTSELHIRVSGQYICIENYGNDSELFSANGHIPKGRYRMTYQGTKTISLNSGDGINEGYGLQVPQRNYLGTLGRKIQTEGATYSFTYGLDIVAAGLDYEHSGIIVPWYGGTPILATKWVFIWGGTGLLGVEDEPLLSDTRYRLRITGASGNSSNIAAIKDGVTLSDGSLDQDIKDILSGMWMYFENMSWMRLRLAQGGISFSFELEDLSPTDDRPWQFFPQYTGYASKISDTYAINTVKK